jgi:cytochrome c oxidase assembly factor CtaG
VWGELLTTWHTTWVVEIVLTALAALYLRTALHVRGWPVIRTVSAMAALAVVVVTVDTGIGVSAPRSFSVGVVMQLLLTVVVPALWVAGRPLTLLRRGSSEHTAAVLDRLRGSAVVRALTSPPTVLVVFALVVVLSRLTALPVAVAASPTLQVLEQLLFLGSGLLFLHTALGLDRSPERPAPTLRILLVIAAAGATVGVGGVLATTAPTLGPTFSPDDVHRGATILWAAGGGLLLVLAAALGGRWAAGRRPLC